MKTALLTKTTAALMVATMLAAGCVDDAPGTDGEAGVLQDFDPDDELIPHAPGELGTATVETLYGPRKVIYENVEGLAIFEGDIVLGPVHQDGLTEGRDSATRYDARYAWPNGVVPWKIGGPFSPEQETLIRSAIQHWDDETPYTFVEARNELDYIRFVPGNSCSSYVGRQRGSQNITLDIGCGRGAIIHEIGHAVGLWHEQSRADRDDHVHVYWENISLGQEYNFKTYVEQRQDGRTLGPFDWDSIMLYGSYAFSKRWYLPTTMRKEPDGTESVIEVQRDRLSDGDKEGAMRLLVGNGFPLTLTNVNSNLCVDVEYATRNPGAPIIQYTCHRQHAERWSFWVVPGTSYIMIVNEHTGQCLDVRGGAVHNGAALQQWPCNGTPAQQFQKIETPVPYLGSFQLKNRGSGKCVDVTAYSRDPWTKLQQWDCLNGTNQKFWANPAL